MAQLIHHPVRIDPAGSSRSWSLMASRLATWVWPPVEPEAAPRQDGVDAATQEPDPPAWTMKTMHWVPLVVPAAAVLMLAMAVLVGTRLY